jgi:hypothetical protein
MTPCAFLYRPAAYATLFVGIGIGYVGRRWLYRIAKQESSTAWLMMMLVPFYRFFFFFTHVSQTLVPFLLWLCGTLFVISGGFTLVFHTFLEKNGKQLATNPFDFEPPQAEMSTPEAIDAEAARLLLGNKKEARVWLKEPENRHDRQARRLIEGAYANGAKDVYAVGFDDDETQFVVVLPVDAAKRKKLFDWHREADPTVQDVGQKYLLLSPD